MEVLDNPGDRLLEVADLLGLPVLTRARSDGLNGRFPWLAEPGRVLAPVPAAGGAALIAHVGGGAKPVSGARSTAGAQLLTRRWRCPEPGCALFGDAGGGGGAFADLARSERKPDGQPPPSLRAGVPELPPASDPARRRRCAAPHGGARGPHRRAGPAAFRRHRGGAGAGRPRPRRRRRDHPRTVAQRRGAALDQPQPLRIELHGGDLVAHDVSTNGSGVRPAGSMVETERVALPPRQRRVLGRGDLIELYPGVQVGRAAELPSAAPYQPTSVMAEAPTMAMRLLGP